MKYKIWDKKEAIFTPGPDRKGKLRHTAQEYIDNHAPWAANPNAKVIVGGGAINGLFFMEYDMTVKFYKKQGAAITEGMTDEEILAAIEEFEENPPEGEPGGGRRQSAVWRGIPPEFMSRCSLCFQSRINLGREYGFSEDTGPSSGGRKPWSIWRWLF